MEMKEIDYKKLDEELIKIYNSTKKPNKIIESKLKEVIELNES